MAIAYYGVKLSDNVTETPEGYLVFKNAVIGRTGFQTYKGKELPQNELEDQGISVNPNDDVEVYRAPEEVFSPRTIASFNGKPVTDTHPGQMLDIDSVEDFECGQVFNVHEGKEPLEDGNFPLIGDIIVKSKSLIDKWRAGIRELSCGYHYHIAKIGKNICQVDMIGNHVAFVENGRAGAYVKVNDSKPIQPEGTFTNMKEFLKQVRKEGLLSLIKSKPDEVAAAFDAMTEAEEKPAADATPAPAVDAKAKDRERLHKALDKHLDARDNAAAEQEANDEEDMNALKAIFTTPSAESSKAADSEEEQEEEAEQTEEEEHEGGAADESEAEAEGEDEAVQSVAAPVIAAGDRPINPAPGAVDAAYKAGAEAVLKAFKPFVAKAKNKSLTGAFDTTSKLIKGNTWKGNASYGKFARAAATASDSANTGVSKADKLAQDSENAYADMRKQMLGKK